MRHLCPVKYSINRPHKFLSDYLENPEELSRTFLLTKSCEWDYENEWRIIVDKVYNMTEYGMSGLDCISPEAVKEVYLGLNVDQQVKASAIIFCKAHGCKLSQAKLHHTRFILDFEPLPY